MKLQKQIFGRLAMLALLVCCFSLAASAQATEPLMTAQVPFDFEVGERALPAGQYVVKRDPRTPQFLWIQTRDRKISVRTSITAHSLPQQTIQASLTFKVQGERHFLAEVKDTNNSLAYALLRSKDERRLAQAPTIQIPNNTQTND